MAEIVYPSEVATPVQISQFSPLADFCKFAIYPNPDGNGSGNDLTNIVDGKSYTIDGTGITWNSDGSVSHMDESADPDDLPAKTIDLGVIDDGLFGSKSIIFIVDLEQEVDANNKRDYLLKLQSTNNNRAGIRIQTGNWSSNQLEVGMEYANSGGINYDGTGSPQKRSFWVYHYNTVTRQGYLYQDGELRYTFDHTSALAYEQTIANTYVGIGGGADKFYSSALFMKNGEFTQEQIDAAIYSPYSLFETEQQREREYSLKFDGVSNSLSFTLPLDSTTDSANYEWSLEWEYFYEGAVARQLIGNASNLLNYIYTNTQDQLYVATSGGAFQFTGLQSYTNGANTWNTFKLKLTRVASVNTLKLYVNNVEHSLSFTPTNSTFATLLNSIGLVNTNQYHAVNFKYVRWTATGDDNNRFWDFNKTSGDFVKCLLTDSIAQLNGFPSDSGFVRSSDSRDGVEFDGVAMYATLPSATLMSGDVLEIIIEGVTSVSNWMHIIDAPSDSDGSDRLMIQFNGTTNSLSTIGCSNLKVDGVLTNTLPLDGLRHTITCESWNNRRIGTIGARYSVREYFNSKIIAINTSGTVTRNYNFLNTNGLTVPDEANGQDATIVNPPTLQTWSTEQEGIVGYQFDGGYDAQATTIEYGSSSFVLEFDFFFEEVPSLFQISAMWNGQGGTGTFQFNKSGDDLKIDNWGQSILVPLSSLPVPITQRALYRFEDDGVNSRLYQNGVEVATGVSLFVGKASTGGALVIGGRYNSSDREAVRFFSLKAWSDGVLVRSYDPTIPDNDQIIDTIGNNHATINSASTVKWQPVVTTDVITVGTGYTYADLRQAASAEAIDLVANDKRMEFLLGSDCSSNFPDWRLFTTGANNQILVKPFAGLEHDNKANGAGVTCTNTSIYPVVADNGYVTYEDFRLHISATAQYNNGYAGENTKLKGMFVSGEDTANQRIGKITAHNCIFYKIHLRDSGSDYKENMVILVRGGWAESNNWDIMFHGTGDKLVGNLGYCEFVGSYGGSYNLQGSGGSNNVINGTDNVGVNSLNNQPISTWFVDEVNGDYRINATGQDALEGAGLYGNDMLAWAYAPLSAAIDATATAIDTAYASLAATITLQSTIDVNQSSANINHTGNQADINTPYDVLSTLTDSSHATLSAVIELGGSIDVTAALYNTNYSSQGSSVTVGVEIDIVPNTNNTSYDSLNATVNLYGVYNIDAGVTNTNYATLGAYIVNESVTIECICSLEGVILDSIGLNGIIAGDIAVETVIDNSDIALIGAINNSDIGLESELCHCA